MKASVRLLLSTAWKMPVLVHEHQLNPSGTAVPALKGWPAGQAPSYSCLAAVRPAQADAATAEEPHSTVSDKHMLQDSFVCRQVRQQKSSLKPDLDCL
jgi:hypothetical protein